VLLPFKGKGLFVFSDPGGAKPVLALASSLETELPGYTIISDREYAFTADFGLAISKPGASPAETIKKEEPGFIFTGTSYTSAIELDYIAAANEAGIPSFAFVDHLTSIRERFSKEGREIWPGKILLVNEAAKNIALAAGMEEEKLVVFGNPYHQYLQNWRPAISKETFLQHAGLKGSSRKIILYAPDPLSNVNGVAQFGFDETEATVEINRIAGALKDEFVFLFAAHPNQNIAAVSTSLGENLRLLPAGSDLNTFLFYADAVVGFFSNILLEAGILHKKVFRFFVRQAVNDPFADMNIGEIIGPGNAVTALKKLL